MKESYIHYINRSVCFNTYQENKRTIVFKVVGGGVLKLGRSYPSIGFSQHVK